MNLALSHDIIRKNEINFLKNSPVLSQSLIKQDTNIFMWVSQIQDISESGQCALVKNEI